MSWPVSSDKWKALLVNQTDRIITDLIKEIKGQLNHCQRSILKTLSSVVQQAWTGMQLSEAHVTTEIPFQG